MQYYVYANLEGTFVLRAPHGGDSRQFNDLLEALAYIRNQRPKDSADAEVTVFDAFGRVALSSIRVPAQGERKNGGRRGRGKPGLEDQTAA